MKKSLFLTALMVVLGATMAYAQPRAIGLRLGAFDGVSYQHGFGDSNMLEIEAGFNFGTHLGNRIDGSTNGTKWISYGHNIQVAATYDWIDPFNATFPWDHKGEWHWYLGVGGAGGYGWYGYAYNKTAGSVGGANNWGFVGAAGRAGVEYDFWFPLQLSIDYRPTLGVGLIDDNNGGAMAGFYWDIFSLALSARYKF